MSLSPAPLCEYCRGDEESPAIKVVAYEYVETGLRYSGLACKVCADYIESEYCDGTIIAWQVVVEDNKP